MVPPQMNLSVGKEICTCSGSKPLICIRWRHPIICGDCVTITAELSIPITRGTSVGCAQLVPESISSTYAVLKLLRPEAVHDDCGAASAYA
jgi:hypothetical protein